MYFLSAVEPLFSQPLLRVQLDDFFGSFQTLVTLLHNHVADVGLYVVSLKALCEVLTVVNRLGGGGRPPTFISSHVALDVEESAFLIHKMGIRVPVSKLS